jgi:DNA-binding transcriptional LysR family regulator
MANSPSEMAIFERVAARGSFAGAAEDVSLSPSVAKLITRLEPRLGVVLGDLRQAVLSPPCLISLLVLR